MKMLSINLWYDKYSQKTNMQLKTYQSLGFETYILSISKNEGFITAMIYRFTDVNQDLSLIKSIRCKNRVSSLSYLELFRLISDYIINDGYDLVYIRRLMSKFFYFAPYLKKIRTSSEIVYELPTFPFDTGLSIISKIRDILELTVLKVVEKNISLIVAVPVDRTKISSKWLTITNYIDINTYTPPAPVVLDNDINLLIIANLSKNHGYARIIQAIYDYTGIYNIYLTIVSPDCAEYDELKSLVSELNLTNNVNCLSSLSMNEIKKIAATHHIGVGAIPDKKNAPFETSSLKHRDYCALGLPFFTTIKDYSFLDKCPYYLLLDSDDKKINLAFIIQWYESICSDRAYRVKMYNYAAKNLQYYDTAREILNRINLCK